MAKLRSTLDEFKAFVLRGNILDLAVAVVLGVAFGAVIDAFTDGVLMATVAAIVGEPDFDSVNINAGDGEILVGAFLTAVVNFLIIAAVLFFVLKAVARASRPKAEPASEAPSPSDEALLLTEIRDLLQVRPERAPLSPPRSRTSRPADPQ